MTGIYHLNGLFSFGDLISIGHLGGSAILALIKPDLDNSFLLSSLNFCYLLVVHVCSGKDDLYIQLFPSIFFLITYMTASVGQ